MGLVIIIVTMTLIIMICFAECVWYGEVLCDGVVIIVSSSFSPFLSEDTQIADYDEVCLISNLQDLHRWWFESRCSNKRMRVSPRSWEEVVNDPRFKP